MGDTGDIVDSVGADGVIGMRTKGGSFGGSDPRVARQPEGTGGEGRGKADRARIMLMLRKLEDHGRVSRGERIHQPHSTVEDKPEGTIIEIYP